MTKLEGRRTDECSNDKKTIENHFSSFGFRRSLAIGHSSFVILSMIRCGIGYDIHRLAEGRKLILGGIEIPYARGLEGHSDADVLSHAIADALLDAIGAGDIGQHFPNTDEAIRGISSIEILKRVTELLSEKNARVVNIDATIIAEEPKIAPHAPAMRQQIAAAIGVSDSNVTATATTNERLGRIGRGEGMAGTAITTSQTERTQSHA